MKILVTGGTGYIGSHTCIALIEGGHEVVILDNLSNSCLLVLDRIEKISGKRPAFYKGDLLERAFVEQIFRQEKIDAVIHFAGLKAVGESVEKPLEYYYNNITGTLVLCEVMRSYDCFSMVFSSSAVVYGEPQEIPVTERCPKGRITNPYGQTKSMLEQMLIDLHVSDKRWNIMLLRYFNPIGAHKSGLIGEDPVGIPNNLVPYIARVSVGELPYVNVFGKDYDTKDGTGVRDYIHVEDLAKGHVKALERMEQNHEVAIYNLGTGRGYSVLDVIKAYEKACGKKIPYEIKPRRSGDIAVCYADPSKAERELQWTAKKDLEEMCRDSYRWQMKNPDGLRDN